MLNILKNRIANRQSVRTDKRSAAALEFAIIAPLIILLFFAVYDISDAMITYEEVCNAARVIAASASNVSVQGSNSSTKLYYSQVQLEASAIYAQMPTVRSGFHHGIKSITVSSINFEKVITNPACTPGVNCSYLAYVVWSVAYVGPNVNNVFAPALRSCATDTIQNGTATLNPASAQIQTTPAAGQLGDLTSLRTALITTNSPVTNPYPAAPDPIIVVDVHYQYSPIYTTFLKSALDFWADGYWPLRSVQATQLNPNTGVFTPLQGDQQYTGIVAQGTTTNGVVTGPYTITQANYYPPTYTALSGTAPAPSLNSYCISSYYAEPQT